MNYSRRQLEALGEPLGESVTQLKLGGFGRIYGSGGGGPSSSTTYTSNVPEWLRPQTEATIGAAMQEYFNTKETIDPETGEKKYDVTGIKPFVPYSTNMEDYVAGFSPLQQQAQFEAGYMQRPGQFGAGTQYVGQAGMGGLESAGQAYGYGAAGANIGQQGLGYQQYGRDIGQQAMDYGAQAARMGSVYEQMATDPRVTQAYMSPYMQNVVETQKQAAIEDYQRNIMPQIQAQAVKSGAFGGSRDAVQRAIAQRSLASQLQGIQATGTQKAFEDAQRAQQFGVTTGLQGLQGAQAGLGTALQGGQLGLSGIQQALAGQQVGLQGVQGAQAGYGLLGQTGVNLANIGTAQQAADISRMDLQSRMGAEQQAREQQLINQAIQNYGMAREYPYEQLSKFSGLLRGYYTPSTTQSTYQAAANPLSQLTGAGTSAYALSQLGKKSGGKIDEDEAGIDNLMIQRTLEKVSK